MFRPTLPPDSWRRIELAHQAEDAAFGDANALAYLFTARREWGALRAFGFVPEGVIGR